MKRLHTEMEVDDVPIHPQHSLLEQRRMQRSRLAASNSLNASTATGKENELGLLQRLFELEDIITQQVDAILDQPVPALSKRAKVVLGERERGELLLHTKIEEQQGGRRSLQPCAGYRPFDAMWSAGKPPQHRTVVVDADYWSLVPPQTIGPTLVAHVNYAFRSPPSIKNKCVIVPRGSIFTVLQDMPERAIIRQLLPVCRPGEARTTWYNKCLFRSLRLAAVALGEPEEGIPEGLTLLIFGASREPTMKVAETLRNGVVGCVRVNQFAAIRDSPMVILHLVMDGDPTEASVALASEVSARWAPADRSLPVAVVNLSRNNAAGAMAVRDRYQQLGSTRKMKVTLACDLWWSLPFQRLCDAAVTREVRRLRCEVLPLTIRAIASQRQQAIVKYKKAMEPNVVIAKRWEESSRTVGGTLTSPLLLAIDFTLYPVVSRVANFFRSPEERPTIDNSHFGEAIRSINNVYEELGLDRKFVAQYSYERYAWNAYVRKHSGGVYRHGETPPKDLIVSAALYGQCKTEIQYFERMVMTIQTAGPPPEVSVAMQELVIVSRMCDSN